MKAELVPLNGDAPIPILNDVTVVGRREYCDVRIGHPSLSKRHCVLVRTDGLLMLRDLVTTNGSKVNGQRVTWAALLPNDRLTLGGYKLRVYLGSDEALSPSERFDRGLPLPPEFQPTERGKNARPGEARTGAAGGGPAGFPTPTPTPQPQDLRVPARPGGFQPDDTRLVDEDDDVILIDGASILADDDTGEDEAEADAIIDDDD